ncbi:VV A32-like packaging ATPase, partial [uncultured virus]
VSDTLFLRRFPMQERLHTRKEGKRVLIVGMSGSGKSTVALDILRFNRHNPGITVFSPSESRNHTFEPHVHPLFLHDELNIEELQEFRERQEARCADWQIPNTKPPEYSRDPSATLMLDDCNIAPKLFKDDIFNWVYYNSR